MNRIPNTVNTGQGAAIRGAKEWAEAEKGKEARKDKKRKKERKMKVLESGTRARIHGSSQRKDL